MLKMCNFPNYRNPVVRSYDFVFFDTRACRQIEYKKCIHVLPNNESHLLNSQCIGAGKFFSS